MKYKWIALLLALLMWTGCSTVKTNQDYIPNTDFKFIRTLSWESAEQPKAGDERIDNPFLNTRIRDAIQSRFEAKGFTFETGTVTDVRVRYQYVLRQRIDASDTRGGVGFIFGGYGRGGGLALGTGGDVYQFDEATLVIDLVSAESGKLLWRGSGTERFREYSDPAKAVKDTDALVEAILNQFPPKG